MGFIVSSFLMGDRDAKKRERERDRETNLREEHATSV